MAVERRAKGPTAPEISNRPAADGLSGEPADAFPSLIDVTTLDGANGFSILNDLDQTGASGHADMFGRVVASPGADTGVDNDVDASAERRRCSSRRSPQASASPRATLQ